MRLKIKVTLKIGIVCKNSEEKRASRDKGFFWKVAFIVRVQKRREQVEIEAAFGGWRLS